jgi:hypothetical protein
MKRGLLPLAYLAIALIAVASSAASLGNGFAYDDVHAIQRNPAVHSIHGLDRFFTQTYWPPGKFQGGATLWRPLASLAFAVEWVVGRGSPLAFHLANLLLYVAVCLALLWVTGLLLPPACAWLVAALFAAHPVHVEAVANSVGQSELWVGLYVLLAIGLFLRYRTDAGLAHGARLAIYLLYALACLTKDNGLILIGLLLAAELTVVRDRRPLSSRLLALKSFWIALAAIAAGYLVARFAVTGTLAGDYPHVAVAIASFPERLLTMLRMGLEWARLLAWPAHLRADYSPPEFDRAGSFGMEQAAGALLVVLVGVAAWVARRRRPEITFGILWAGAALFPVSNLLLKSGVLVAERTLFLPSAGVMLAVGGGLAAWLEREQRRTWLTTRLAWSAAAVLIGLGVWRSALRQPVWRDNGTLFSQTVRDAPRSYRAHWVYGLYLFDHGNHDAAFAELESAISLYPRDASLYGDVGDVYRSAGRCDLSVTDYQQALAMDPGLKYTRARLASCYLRLGRYADARIQLEQLVDSGSPEFAPFIQTVDSVAAAAGAFR